MRPHWRRPPIDKALPWLKGAGDVLALDPQPYTTEADDLLRELQLDTHRQSGGQVHLTRLAQAWRLTGDLRYFHGLVSALDRWLEHAHEVDLAGADTLTHAVTRLLSWSATWQILSHQATLERIPALTMRRWLEAVIGDAHWVRTHRSRFSRINAHALYESIGLLAAAVTWPHRPEMNAWGQAADRQFRVEFLRQSQRDGTSADQSWGSVVTLLETLAIYVRISHTRRVPIDERIRDRAAALVQPLLCAGRVSDHPQAGVGECALTPPPPHLPGHPTADERLVAAVRALGIPDRQHISPSPAHELWLTGTRSESPSLFGRSPGLSQTPRRQFPDAGYHLLGRNLGQDDEVRIVVDAGPLGFQAAAQAHADALSIRLSVHGRPILVDRGSEAPDASAPWFEALRSTRNHSTVCLDQRDQALQVSGERGWSTPVSCQVSEFRSTNATGRIRAHHDGYRRLSPPALHTREVLWDGKSDTVTVIDEIERKGPSSIEVCWQFAPELRITIEDDFDARALIGTLQVALTVEADCDAQGWRLERGNRESLLGWQVLESGARIAAPTLIWRGHSRGATRIVTRLHIQHITRRMA